MVLVRAVSTPMASAMAEAPWDGTPEADAAITATAGLLLGIQTADCFPLLVVDPPSTLPFYGAETISLAGNAVAQLAIPWYVLVTTGSATLTALAVFFNFLPIAPLDGFKVVQGILPRELGRSFATLEAWGPGLLLALIALPRKRVDDAPHIVDT